MANKLITLQDVSGNNLYPMALHNSVIDSNGVNLPSDFTTIASTSDIPSIPTTSTAGKVLKSTSTAGTVEWGTLSASDVGALASNTTYVSSVNGNSGAITGVEVTSNKVTSLSSQSTDTQYPSAKCVYDIVGNIETLLAQI